MLPVGRSLPLLVSVGLLGCGRLHYAVDGGAAAPDATALDDAGPIDAPPPIADAAPDAGRPPACDWVAPEFETPTLVHPGVADPYAISLSPDGLTVFFTLSGVVQSATRPSLDAVFGPPSRLEEVYDPAYAVDGVVFRRDGLELIMASESLGGAGRADLFHRVRASRSDAWSAPMPLVSLNTDRFDWDYFLEPDGLTLWFQRQTLDVGSADVFRAVRPTLEQPFGAAAAVAALSRPGVQESAATLPDDGSVVVASVAEDIQFSRVVGGEPAPPTPLPELNSAEIEYEPTVRSDGCEILFVSNRDGTMRLYRASRAR